MPPGWQLRVQQLELAVLTEWAVEARYPGDWPEASPEDAEQAIRAAREALALVVTDLSRHGVGVED